MDTREHVQDRDYVSMQIYSGKKRSTGEDVAIKYLPKSQQDGGLPKAVVREVQALQQLQGEPNIINYHGMYENVRGCLYLIIMSCNHDYLTLTFKLHTCRNLARLLFLMP